MLHHNVQGHLGQSEETIFCACWLHALANFEVRRSSAFVGASDVISHLQLIG